MTEAVTHYGESIKAIMNEELGDGIMSAIDMYATVRPPPLPVLLLLLLLLLRTDALEPYNCMRWLVVPGSDCVTRTGNQMLRRVPKCRWIVSKASKERTAWSSL